MTSMTMLPFGAASLAGALKWAAFVPIYLILSLAECAVMLVIYHFVRRSNRAI